MYVYRNLTFGTSDDLMHCVRTWTQRGLQLGSFDEACEQLPLTQSYHRDSQTTVLRQRIEWVRWRFSVRSMTFHITLPCFLLMLILSWMAITLSCTQLIITRFRKWIENRRPFLAALWRSMEAICTIASKWFIKLYYKDSFIKGSARHGHPIEKDLIQS